MTSRQYTTLGKILCAEHPELAQQLADQLNERKALFSDLKLLPHILQTFCELKNITLDQMSTTERALPFEKMHKHIFTATVVKLYSPETLGPTKEKLVDKLRETMAPLLNTRGDRLSKIIANTRVYLATYKQFAREVEETCQVIITIHGNNTSNQRPNNPE
jgi:hypothetical protein